MSFVLLGILNSQAAASGPLDIEYLVIAGGGGGGQASGSFGGGGGAGGYRSSVQGESSGGGGSAESVLTLEPATNYTVTVGAGGAGVLDRSNPASNGSNSVFHTITSNGGGAGGNEALNNGGQNGGSGGGDAGNSNYVAGIGTSLQGFDGSPGSSSGETGGGGGGASENGFLQDGGDGISSSITGSAIFRAGGGASGKFSPRETGTGGLGGGADAVDGGSPDNAEINTGGGGAGGNDTNIAPSGSGGSGIVILRYPSDYTINIGAGLTGSESTDGNFKYAEITAGTGNVSWS